MNHLFRKIICAIFIISSISFLVYAQHDDSGKISFEPYIWKNVQIVGGGFVTGIIFHPTEKGLCYCRTDMGGAYRRNPETMRWEPLLDWVSYEDLNLMGVESIALDPSDPERVYMACGTYTNPRTPDGAILWSDDRGKSFNRTNVPFKMGGNEDGRGNGERMSVDPNDGNILYMGTRNAGLWRSADRAVTWSKVESFPDITENPPADMRDQDSITRWRWMNRGSGIIFTIFDPYSGNSGTGSSVIYAGVSLMNRDNLFRSTDSGNTWHPVPGQPVQYRPTHAALDSDGIMYITYGNSPGPSRMTDGYVWKFNTKTGEWTEITPDQPDAENRPFGYAAVSVDANNPRIIIVSTYHRYGIEKGDDIFRSLDGGQTWDQVFGSDGKGVIESSLAPYTAFTGIHWLFDIEIDPFNPDHAIFTTGYGGHETFNLSDMDKGLPTKWAVMSPGIEETVPLDLLSPPRGAHLITGVGDYGGSVHWDLDKPAPEGNFSNPRFGNTNDLDCAENNPDIIVRVGRATGDNPGKTIGYSLDSGRTWQPTPFLPHPESALGHIAVSSDRTTWIWTPDPVRRGFGSGRTPEELPVYRTSDRGETWSECKGIPKNTRVIADRRNPKKFYALDLFGGKLFISKNRGIRFKEKSLNILGDLPKQTGNRGDSRGGQDQIYAVPGREGDLWIAAFDGLYHSVNTGKNFLKINDVSEIHGFGFGKAAPDSNYPSLYLIGNINGVRGIFRSDDFANSWVRINDDQHQWGLLLHITGDPKLYGRAYVGTHGRGAFYGDPVSFE